MSQAKKFGAFAGVFTPSILTILGVIMYMRLGWVVGQAGLINTLAIIFIAHIISVTTGLSISSIATDKKIRTGGIYYMLSRSLGLPAGGAIGLTIFVGTALSISLYIVGFAESFLSLDAVANFLHLTPGIDGYRIVGTVVIIILVILALISTSVVIKTQYFILGAIALSLISIVVGIFWRVGYHPSQTAISMAEGADALPVIFGIFFPAVTGFTAGVAMSGDLKNPKKDIPKGTLLAILVGLIVYVSLAVLFAVFIRRDMLVGDPNFLLKIAWFSPLVIAGIWGATLSSALGGILGAPRIMQAIAMDKIMPRIFARGAGKSNEPRNALILTFLIAEAGILIGELNVIAGVVSMFYIAAYGFINLAFTLENWASTDFRPSFKVNRWIGIIGFIACFAVMYELDAPAMIAAIVIIAVVYLLLRRKNLQSEYGDVWTSVWNSLTRSALHRANKRTLEERNWRPNIILFSGGTKSRPYLVEFGKWLAGKHGFLSNFDLTTGKGAVSITKKQQQTETPDEAGIFTRNHVCEDIYEGIETIAQTYGFSGIEPNTVFMGWANQTRDADRFVKLLENLYRLDLNVLMLDYDHRKGFGKQKLIDIYLRPDDLNGIFPLFIVRFLWYTDIWAKSKLRVMVINDHNEDSKTIFRSVNQILDKVRIDAGIRVLNNQLEHRPHHEIIRNESDEADLIIMGIPDFEKQNSEEWIKNTDILCRDLGSVLLVKSSSEFERLNLGYRLDMPLQTELDLDTSDIQVTVPTIVHPELAEQTTPVINELISGVNNYAKATHKIGERFNHFFTTIEKITNDSLSKALEEVAQGNDSINAYRNTYRKLIINLRKEYTGLEEQILPFAVATLRNAGEHLAEQQEKIVKSCPWQQEITLGEESTRALETDSEATTKYRNKLQSRLSEKGKGIRVNVPVQQHINSILKKNTAGFIVEQETTILHQVIKNYLAIQQLHDALSKGYVTFIKGTENDRKTQLSGFNNLIGKIMLQAKEENKKTAEGISKSCNALCGQRNSTLAGIFNSPDRLKKAEKNGKYEKAWQEYRAEVNQRFEAWEKSQQQLFNSISLEINLMLTNTVAESSTSEIASYIKNVVVDGISGEHKRIIALLRSGDYDINEIKEGNNTEDQLHEGKTAILTSMQRLQRKINRFPAQYTVLENDFFNAITAQLFDEPEIITIQSRQLLDHMYQQEYAVPVRRIVDEAFNMARISAGHEQEILTRLAVAGLTTKERQEYVASQIEMITHEIETMSTIARTSSEKLMHVMDKFTDSLSLQQYLKAAENMRQYIRRQEREKRTGLVVQHFIKAGNGFRNLLTQLWYRRSHGVLLHERLVAGNESATSGDQISRVSAQLNTEVSKTDIPYFYRQLFLRKQQYSSEFWVGRAKETDEFMLYLRQYRQIRSGAIMVTGERYSGKSYFCEHMATEIASGSAIRIVTPPPGGSTNRKTFYAILTEALEGEGKSWSEALEELPENSIIIIEDLEMWWQRGENGNQILEIISKLIDKYSHKVLFILSAGKHAWKVIRKISSLEDSFIGQVRLLPFDAKEVETIVMRRHKAGGLQFIFDGRQERNFRPWHYARLFSRYFSFSKGNIGAVLHAWIANITHIDGDTLYMRNPRTPQDLPLESLSETAAVCLVQIIIHRQMNIEKLAQTMQMRKDEIAPVVAGLLRKNLIVGDETDIYGINPTLYRFVIDRLLTAEML